MQSIPVLPPRVKKLPRLLGKGHVVDQNRWTLGVHRSTQDMFRSGIPTCDPNDAVGLNQFYWIVHWERERCLSISAIRWQLPILWLQLVSLISRTRVSMYVQIKTVTWMISCNLVITRVVQPHTHTHTHPPNHPPCDGGWTSARTVGAGPPTPMIELKLSSGGNPGPWLDHKAA